LPLISGYIRQAFFNAAGMGLKVIVSAEYLVQTRNSLGKAVYSSSYFLDYAEVYAYAFFMVLMVLIITELPALLINRIEKNSLR
jgi:ABC-type nitrate/sulfonate/bicarbonate transport system permease component